MHYPQISHIYSVCRLLNLCSRTLKSRIIFRVDDDRDYPEGLKSGKVDQLKKMMNKAFHFNMDIPNPDVIKDFKI